MQNDIGIHKNSKLLALCSMLRYRFFLFAGIFPYLLGQVIAFNANRFLDWHYFWLGFLGILLVLIGVELLNEYFDAKEGGDRIFSQQKLDIPGRSLLFALCSMLYAFFIGLYLAFHIGWPVLLFSFLGFLGAYFYVGPPLRWAYRGLGEIVIALSYGPFMVLGSYYLQTERVDFVPFIVSLVCGLSIFSLAILNEIPDYIQDKLVGKKNIVVRLGREKSIKVVSLSSICAYVLLGLGIWWKEIPYVSLVAFLMLPFVLNNIRIAKGNVEKPKFFTSVIRITVVNYIIVVFSLGISYLRGL